MANLVPQELISHPRLHTRSSALTAPPGLPNFLHTSWGMV